MTIISELRVVTRIKRIVQAAAIAAIVALAAGEPVHAQGISVDVNNQPISFSGAPPQEINGSVLVPLRGVFEELGATVNYDPSTKAIQAKNDNTVVLLTLGNTTAFVNNQATTLAQPPLVIDGTTLVPLRFVAESFGAYVEWDGARQTVMITTQGQSTPQPQPYPQGPPPPPQQPNYPPPVPQGDTTIHGRVTGVYLNSDPPQFTIDAQGQPQNVTIDQNTVLLLSHDHQPGIEMDVSALQPGDRIYATINDQGVADVIHASYQDIHGAFQDIQPQPDGTFVVTLGSGLSINLDRSAQAYRGGQRIRLQDIAPNEQVWVRKDDSTKQGYRVFVGTPPPGRTPLKRPLGRRPDAPPSGLRPMSYINPPALTAPEVAVTIGSFTTDIKQPLRGGAVIHAILRGSPGGKATMIIPNVADSVPMKETSPGFYETTYSVPVTANVTGDAVLGSLVARDGTGSPLVPAEQSVTIDNTAPSITWVNPPAHSSTPLTSPLIYAVLSDGDGSGVDIKSVQLRLDNVDVTSSASVSDIFVAFTPSEGLADGGHTLQLDVQDLVGNKARKVWTFQVDRAQPGIQSFASDRTGHVLHVSEAEPLHLVLHAQPGGAAAAIVGSTERIPLQETSAGVYEADFVPMAGSSVEDAPVVARFVSRDRLVSVTSLPQMVDVEAGLPDTPVIISPNDGDQVGNTVVISGRATPNAAIIVRINYVSKALGIFTVTGNAAEEQLRADAQGHWQTNPVTLQAKALLGKTRNTTFTVSATAVDAVGQESDAASVVVTQD